ncbi:MAG: hypothetical protein O3B76_03795 [Proteobacteria bacterium]|nr:hypothetical protein [Pseudomonadota bacterium]MDA1022683.1 hypothetical protein [Pseudomonadota bacterium]
MSRILHMTALLVSGVLLSTPATALAQSSGEPGYSRLQGGQYRSSPPQILAQAAPAGPLAAPNALQTDLRQQMRMFIQTISAFARRMRPGFSVLTRGGVELIIKRDPVDETRIFPSRSYIRAIDGVIQEGLFFREKPFSAAPSEERQVKNLLMTGMAKNNGLRVLVVDYGATPQIVDESRKRNTKLGFTSTTLHMPLAGLGSLPPYPSRPFGESSSSINSLKKISNFAIITNSAAYGSPSEFALKMHDTNFDLLIVDVYHGRKPLSRQAVETLKFKKIGARRLVFATMDIGSAASYRYYWKGNWREGFPDWISAPVRDDPDRNYVQYWRPEWQRIITGDAKSYIYGIIRQGFDGVVLEGVEEAYRFFESGGEEEEEAPAPTPAAAPAPVAVQAPAAAK